MAVGLVSLAALLVPGEIWTVAAPMLAVWVAALVWLGMPHGGAGDLVARALLRPRIGRVWLPLFLVGYLAVSALVLAFLAVAALYFRMEETVPRHPGDTRPRGLPTVAALGGLPVALRSSCTPTGRARFSQR